ncbi:MAG: hypothetical protein IH994_13125 [Proteobacteria bacterium]|nr:hypothetical protein [Pseudomonadota bacterium]
MADEMPLQQRLRRCQWFYIVPGEDRGLREGGCPQEAAEVLDQQEAEIEELLRGIKEIQAHAARHMRCVAGQPQGPLATIVDLARELPSVKETKNGP